MLEEQHETAPLFTFSRIDFTVNVQINYLYKQFLQIYAVPGCTRTLLLRTYTR